MAVLRLSREQAARLRGWFLPDQAGPQVGLHVLNTGHGACFVDHWPEPRVVLAGTAGTYALAGEPDVLAPTDVQTHIVTGSIEASERFEGLLRSAFPVLGQWMRLILDLSTPVAPIEPPPGAIVRVLGLGDAADLARLDPALAWITGTWSGPLGLAESGYAWGAFVAGLLVAVACSFFVGEHYEDIGFVTEAAYRGLGLGTACAASLSGDIQRRGHRPSWTTPTNNPPSLRVAEKLGFEVRRSHRLLLVGVLPPEPG